MVYFYWNGHSLFRWHTLQHSVTIIIQTDASWTLGCGAVFGNLWLQWKWPLEWQPLSIMAKELVPIVSSCAVWGLKLVQKPVLFQCDNLSLVTALKKAHAKTSWSCNYWESLHFLLPTLTYTFRYHLLLAIPCIHSSFKYDSTLLGHASFYSYCMPSFLLIRKHSYEV